MMRFSIFLAILALCSASSAIGQTVSAILEPTQQVALQPTFPGRIEVIHVLEGDRVKTGDILAEMEAGVQRARVRLAEQAATATGPTDRAAIVVQQAQAVLDRVTTARNKGAAQAWELRQAEQTLGLARADEKIAQEAAKQLKAQLQLEQETLANFFLAAPFDAVVLEVFAEPGQTITDETPVLEIGLLDQLKATAFVPVEWLDDIEVGNNLSVQVLSSAPVQADALVRVIDPRVDPASRSVRIVLSLENPDGAILPGTAIEVQSP